jgi:recombinational DNA repair protein (RecF pathway)
MAKIRDCAECCDPHDVKEMYPTEGRLICEHCMVDSFFEEAK